MLSPADNSVAKSNVLADRAAQQNVMLQIQSESLELIRLNPDETFENLPNSIHFGDWSSTVENEISRCLW